MKFQPAPGLRPGRPKTLTRDDLARVIRRNGAFSSQQAAKAIVDEVIEQIGLALGQGADVKISGFASFIVGETLQRTGRNPRQPDVLVQIPPHRRVYFRPSRLLIEQMNSDRPRKPSHSVAGKRIRRDRR